jgi:hypothetical protein
VPGIPDFFQRGGCGLVHECKGDRSSQFLISCGCLFFFSCALYLIVLQVGEKVRNQLKDLDFSPVNSWSTLLENNIGEVFGEYVGVVSYLFSMKVADALFFMLREYFRWDTFVLRSPVIASFIATARVAVTIFLIVKVLLSFEYMKPATAAAGGIICAICILIPVSPSAQSWLQGRLSALISYSTRVLITVIGVPIVWHFVFVEEVINPVAGPVFTDSTPTCMMMCFWLAGSVVGLMLHSAMDKQVLHMAPAINKQGLLFAWEALKPTTLYAFIQLFLSLFVSLALNFFELIVGEFGDFNLALVGRMFFATAFCTFLTWIAALYLAACLDPHPSCSLSIADARLLASGFNSSQYAGCVSYR